MSDDKNVRHRFTVPAADTVVNEWIEHQSNLGFSLRTLIKAFVKGYGYQDATCLELGVPVKKRGRPPKQAQIQYGLMNDDTIDEFDDDENDVSDNEPETISEPDIRPVVKQTVQPTVKPMVKPVAKPVDKPIVKSVDKTQAEYGFVSETNTSADDLVNMLSNPSVSNMQKGRSVSKPVTEETIESDDDGFVDPASLF